MTISHTPTRSRAAKAALALSVASVLALAFASPASAAQDPVQLGTATSFAVLAGTGIVNTGPTTVSGTNGGDMGSSPTTTFDGEASVTTTGTKYIEVAGSAVVDGAKTDLVLAYNDAASRGPTTTIAANLGGQTLVPGVYNSGSSIGLTGVLTLDAGGDEEAVFIFQAGSTLTTASASSIALLNGAQACNVFWQVGSSATFGTGSSFVGTVMAMESITATTGATFNGQLLARDGAVTLDTNTIVNDACTFTPAPEAPAPTPAPAPVPPPEDATEEGGVIPETGTTDWLVPLAIGVGIATVGILALLRNRRRA
jgi:LPXTG-motif cell wall-anchored protein